MVKGKIGLHGSHKRDVIGLTYAYVLRREHLHRVASQSRSETQGLPSGLTDVRAQRQCGWECAPRSRIGGRSS